MRESTVDYYKAAVEMMANPKWSKQDILSKYKIREEDFAIWADELIDSNTFDSYYDCYLFDNKKWK